MDNALVYEAGDCGSIPYEGTKFRIGSAKFNNSLLLKRKGTVRLRSTGSMPVFGVTVALC